MELEKIKLPWSSTVTTRVGFGCSNLLGEKTREMGLRLLETAYDCGIRHFDVARVYNFGDAETILGEFAAGKRDKITLSTKFGLMPREGVARMRGPVQMVRRVMRSSSWLRKLVRRNVKKLTQAGQFDLATAHKSLEASLRALRTDYLDLYLMHECSSTDCTPEIYEFLLQAKQQGKIRAHGCGTAFGRLTPIAAEHPDFLEAAQFESSVVRPNVAPWQVVKPAATQLSITHGAMGAAQFLRHRMESDSSFLKSLQERFGAELLMGSGLYGLLLGYALHENAEGVVLFRAAAEDRIQATLKYLWQAKVHQEDLHALPALIAEPHMGPGDVSSGLSC